MSLLCRSLFSAAVRTVLAQPSPAVNSSRFLSISAISQAGQQKREPGAPRDPDALAQEQEDQKPSSSKSSRTSSRENDNEPRSKRVSSTGKEGDKQTRGIKSEKIQSDDGSLEYKEKLSPGSTDKKKISDNKSSTNEDVPDEVKEKLHADTINMIKKESGMSGGMGS